MAVVRYGTRCEHTSRSGRRCDQDPCPGSGVYVYECDDDVFVCSGCSLTPVDPRFGIRGECRGGAPTMAAHLDEHVRAGHHVSQAVLRLLSVGQMRLKLTVEFDREVDGRHIAQVLELPGCLVYGETRVDAEARVRALALHILADQVEHGERDSRDIR